MTEDHAKNLLAHIRSLWPKLDWAKEIQDEVFARLLREQGIELGEARKKLVDARIAIKFESIQPAEVWEAIAPKKPEPKPPTWAEMHPDRESEIQRAAASMQRLRDRFTKVTGKNAKGPEFWDWILSGEPQEVTG